MSTPILSRSAGCPLTDKVALATMYCHMFLLFCVYATLLNSYIGYKVYNLFCLFFVFFINVVTVMPVLCVTG